MTPRDPERRRLIKAVVKGLIYTAPIITSMAAPQGLMGQGPSGMMMFCDYFPVLCMIFGGGAPAPGASPQRTAPGAPPPGTPTPPPPTPPPPSQINPPPGR
jgi:hypothetical protein